MEEGKLPRICIVQPNPCSPTETFLQAHADHLPGVVAVVAGRPSIGGQPIMPVTITGRAMRKAIRSVLRLSWFDDLTAAYLKVFRHHRPDAVLAEYGPTGGYVVNACRQAGIPLIVHFHGFDASDIQTLEAEKTRYPVLFRDAAAIVAVSQSMRQKLIELGAPAEKVHWNPYGVDCTAFSGADPATAGPVFLAVGRFLEKKAPGLTLRAFAEVFRACPEARLRMVGFGPLHDSCVQLAGELGIAGAVDFLGKCSPQVVQQEMRHSRCFVQHSVVAPDGDSEGTPVAILEAGASGLPVVSTRHGGIPDVVLEGRTGFLVEERDVSGMASKMLCLAKNPILAGRLGWAAREWIETEFMLPKRIGALWNIIESCLPGPVNVIGSCSRLEAEGPSPSQAQPLIRTPNHHTLAGDG
jgi:glycosyltransferase involved in cell wall biosynthesis